MKLIDLHCDTILKCMGDNKRYGLYQNDFCIDIQKLKRAGSKAEFFALYVDLPLYQNPLEACLEMLDKFYVEMDLNHEYIAPARSYREMQENKERGKISAFLTIEEGGVLKGELHNLRNFYRLGVRLITLTWNYPNELGFPTFGWTYQNKGLTEKGFEVVSEMNQLGMLIDVSHLSDQGFYDVSEQSKTPFVASHSNARVMTNNPRNMTDDMIRVLAEKGGVMGLNFEPTFLSENGEPDLSDIARHALHIRKTGGIEVLAIGGDLDGTTHPAGLSNIGEIGRLADVMKRHGFSESELEKIFYKNAERVIKEVLK